MSDDQTRFDDSGAAGAPSRDGRIAAHVSRERRRVQPRCRCQRRAAPHGCYFSVSLGPEKTYLYACTLQVPSASFVSVAVMYASRLS